MVALWDVISPTPSLRYANSQGLNDRLVPWQPTPDPPLPYNQTLSPNTDFTLPSPLNSPIAVCPGSNDHVSVSQECFFYLYAVKPRFTVVFGRRENLRLIVVHDKLGICLLVFTDKRIKRGNKINGGLL